MDISVVFPQHRPLHTHQGAVRVRSQRRQGPPGHHEPVQGERGHRSRAFIATERREGHRGGQEVLRSARARDGGHGVRFAGDFTRFFEVM